jgi:hypothetical protein
LTECLEKKRLALLQCKKMFVAKDVCRYGSVVKWWNEKIN